MLEGVGDCDSVEKPDKGFSSESSIGISEVEGVGSGILGCIAQERFKRGWSCMTGLSSLSDSVADERITVESETTWVVGLLGIGVLEPLLEIDFVTRTSPSEDCAERGLIFLILLFEDCADRGLFCLCFVS